MPHAAATIKPNDRATPGNESAEEARIAKLTAMALSLKDSRKLAMDARIQSGIEEQWREDLEFYEGIDDANRAEMGAFSAKPPGQIAVTVTKESGELKSNVFVNVTRPYCDAAAARISDMLMPTDDRAFAIKPTPVPDLEGMATGKLSISAKEQILQETGGDRDKTTAMAEQIVDKARLTMEKAKEAANHAQEQIDDWLTECQYHAETRKVIEDAAKIGTGILKGPVAVKNKSLKIGRSEIGEITIEADESIQPASRRIDPRNLFPDPACGENIHNGSYIWERDFLSRRQVEELKASPGYIDSEIDIVLKEGPQTAVHPTPDNNRKHDPNNKDRFEIWYYHGIVRHEDLETAGVDMSADRESAGEESESGQDVERLDQEPPKPDAPVHAAITMINDRVVKGSRNHLSTGEFPYDVMVWQRQSGTWTGIGVARQIRTPQRIINAATRNMMDNAGLTSGPQILMRLGKVEPADGQHTITPRKVWYILESAEVRNVNEVFGTFDIPTHQAELLEIVQFGLKLAEDVTGLPLLLQGQQGEAPDTLGGMQLVNNNASTVLRRLAKLYDDGITTPHIRRYYVWVMQYGEEHQKGDHQIDARGSSALVERDIQNQAILAMGQMTDNPKFGIDPKKWYAQWARSQRLNPKDFQYTEEEQNQLDKQPPPQDPRIEVAQIQAQAKEALAKMSADIDARIIALEKDWESKENDKDRAFQAWLKEQEQGGKKAISFDTLKTKLADTSMRLKTQRDLSAADHVAEAIKPPSEPAGRAKRGKAFQA